MNTHEQIKSILETYGGETANKTSIILLKDKALKKLSPLLEFVTKTWRDPLTPAMLNLSCQAVEGNPKETQEVAAALSLMNLSFRVWDDVIDKTVTRRLNYTLVGKFGETPSIVIGGVTAAKAFTLLNEVKLEPKKKEQINQLIWAYWAKMAETEVIYSKKELCSSRDKLTKMSSEAINLETCMKIGAIIGNASPKSLQALANYGHCLGVIFELEKDLQVSFNLTLELGGKIRKGELPYTFLKAKEQSKQLEQSLDTLKQKTLLNSADIAEITKLLIQTRAPPIVEAIIHENVKKAKGDLNKLPKNPAIEVLLTILDFQTRSLSEFFSS